MSPNEPKGSRPWWLVILDNTNFVIPTLTAIYLIFTRSAGVAYFATGAVLCSLTAKLVKKVVRQPRPNRPNQRKVTYGMPSTHSAAIAYYATYIPLTCAYIPMHSFLPARSVLSVVAPLVLVPSAAVIASSRVWLGHHTRPQVAVGSLYGTTFAFLWFTLWTNGVDEHARLVENFLRLYFNNTDS